MPEPVESKLNPIQESEASRLQKVFKALQAVNAVDFDHDQTLSLAVSTLRNHLGIGGVSLFLLDAARSNALLEIFDIGQSTQANPSDFSIEIKPKSDLAACINQKQVVIAKKLALSPQDPRYGFSRGWQMCALLPLYSSEESFGALELIDPSAKIFSSEDLTDLELLAGQLSALLWQKISGSSSSRLLNGYRAIHKLSTDSDHSMKSDEILHRMLALLSALLPSSRITFLSPEHQDHLRIRAYAGYSDGEATTLHLAPGGGAAGRVAQERKCILIDDTLQNPEIQGLSPDSRSIMAVPILVNGSLVGVLDIEKPQTYAFSEDDLELTTALAGEVACMLSGQVFVDQTRQQVDQQKQLYEITNKIRQSTHVETILRTSVEELCTVLNLPKATIRLNSSLPTGETSNSGEKPL
jgi:GAF domain-containing protein